MEEQKKTHGAGYRVFHTILCVIVAIYLLFGITVSTAARHWLKTDKLENAIAAADIGNYKIPFTGKTVAEKIRAEYITDEEILTEDVASAINSIGVTNYAAEKIGLYFDMLRGDTDKIVQISPKEIPPMLENNRVQVRKTSDMIIEDSDMEQLESELKDPFDTVNKVLDTCYGSPALRFCARFRVSIWRTIIDLVLLALLLWRWTSVCAKSGKSRSRGVKGMGITMIVVSVLPFVVCMISLVAGLFAKDGAQANAELMKQIRAPFTICTLSALAAGIILILLSKAPAKLAARPKKVRPERAEKPLDRTAEMPAVRLPEPVPAPVPTPAPATENFCIRCGKSIKEGAKFCIYCGAPQNDTPVAPEEPTDHAEIPAEDPIADVPEAIENTPVSEAEAPAPAAEAPVTASTVAPKTAADEAAEHVDQILQKILKEKNGD